MSPDQRPVEITGEVAMARKPRRAALVIACVVLVLAASYLASSTADDHSSAPADVEATTATTAARAPTTTSRPATSAASTTSSTIGPLGICHTLPRAVPTLLPSANTSIGLVDKEGEILRLDLAAGELTCLRGVDSALTPWARPDGMTSAFRSVNGTVASSGWETGWYLPDDDALPVHYLEQGQTYPGPLGTVWLVRYGADGWGMIVELRPVDGGDAIMSTVLPPNTWIGGHSGGRLVAIIAGSGFLIDPDGRRTRLWEGGALLAINRDHALSIASTSDGSTFLAKTDLATGVVRALGPVPRELNGCTANLRCSLSPDGNTLAISSVPYDLSIDLPKALDVRAGEVTTLGKPLTKRSADPFAWSSDSQWMLWIDVDGGLNAWSARDGTTAALGAGELPVIWDIFEMP
ncbi:MAG TPA: hypothetical protein VF855_12735 [Acidimicrobiales bacterium]